LIHSASNGVARNAVVRLKVEELGRKAVTFAIEQQPQWMIADGVKVSV